MIDELLTYTDMNIIFFNMINFLLGYFIIIYNLKVK